MILELCRKESEWLKTFVKQYTRKLCVILSRIVICIIIISNSNHGACGFVKNIKISENEAKTQKQRSDIGYISL